MSFVYPYFLYGLLALGIPIIIHLFNFRRARRVYFSNNLFLQQVKKASSTRMKLKHLLILIARLLFIFFLVMTFAQPYIPAEEQQTSGNRVFIYLDNSFSMSNDVEGDLTALEAGITYIQDILEVYPENTEVQLLTNDFAPFSNTAKTSGEILELITELNLSGVTRSIDDILNRIDRVTAQGIAHDIYWISDFQRSTSGELQSLLQDNAHHVFLIPLFFNTTANVYVDTLFLSNPFLIQGEKNEINVELRNDGDQEIRDMPIRLYINDVQSANGSLDIPPFGSKSISFDISYQLERFNEGRISFEDFPVTFDNDFYFSLRLADRISVVELKEGEEMTVVEKVFANRDLFNFNTFNVQNINYSTLENANLIILNGISSIETSIANVLLRFLDQQGDLFVIPAADIDAATYTPLTGSIRYIRDSLRERSSLAGLDLNNPFFTDIFENREGNFDMPEARPVIRPLGMQSPLIRFPDGSQYLSYRDLTNRLYIAASPLLPEFTNLQSHAIFVPVMYRIAMLSKKEFNKLYYTLNTSVISINVDSLDQESLVRLVGTETEIIPGQRRSGNTIYMEIPKFETNPGIYGLRIGEKEHGSIAFNQEKAESKLDQIEISELRELTSQNSALTLFNTTGIDNFDKEIKAKYLGVPLWRYALVLALIFLLAEIMIIRFL